MAQKPSARRLQGSIVAIITPMQADGALDLDGYRALLDWHVQQGTDGIVVVGTTGESPTVDYDEHCLLIKTTVDHIAGRIPVIAGTGANSTSEAIELSEYAQKAGADMTLSVVPYYNKPSQEGIYLHFKAIAEKADIPMIVYNVPGRTVADMQNDTVLRLAQIPNIVGIKDSSGDLTLVADLIRRVPSSFAVLQGRDTLIYSALALGAVEVVGARSPARMLGIRGQENFIRACGAREIMQGVAILGSKDPTPWIWARVAGGQLAETELDARAACDVSSGEIASAVPVAGMDIVEVSPPYDGPGAITGVLAANLLFELLSVVALSR